MTIQVELSPEAQARLAAEAAMQGVAPEEYASQLLQQALNGGQTRTGALTSDELHAMLREIGEGSENRPTLPTTSFVRESFYDERV